MAPDSATLERQLKLYKGLVEVSALINAITRSSELLPSILEVAQRVLQVEAASLFLVTASGDLELACAEGGPATGPPMPKLIVPRGRGISGWVIEHGQPLLVPDAYADPRFYQDADRQTGFRTRSILCTPLRRDGKEIGVLQVLNPVGRAAFDATDLEAFEAYGNLAATAIDKLRTIERQREQDRVAQELAFAREIQSSFLPQTLPQHPHLSFASTYRPALTVGGDFYDVLEAGPDEIFFTIGDVSGKGMPAALLMAQTLSMLRLLVKPGLSPAEAMTQWNARLTGKTVRGMFITALLGRIVLSTREVEVCSAGHCHPLLVSGEGRVAPVPIAGSPPLGLLPRLTSSSHRLVLAPGEWLVLYTDGLIESFDAQERPLDRGGAERALGRHFASAVDVVRALTEAELRHRGEVDPHDDLTLLTFGFQ
jgi:sigma-B regulation protein RsbU (phosphoserine phosphatase)